MTTISEYMKTLVNNFEIVLKARDDTAYKYKQILTDSITSLEHENEESKSKVAALEHENKALKAKIATLELRHESRAGDYILEYHNIKVGDILCWKWQHLKDETTWYQVIKTTPTQVCVREIRSKVVKGSGMKGESIPSRDDFKDDEVLVRTVMPNSIRINSCQSAYLWDGEPKHHDYYS